MFDRDDVSALALFINAEKAGDRRIVVASFLQASARAATKCISWLCTNHLDTMHDSIAPLRCCNMACFLARRGCKFGNIDAIRILLENGLPPNIWTCCRRPITDYGWGEDLAKLLVSYGAPPDCPFYEVRQAALALRASALAALWRALRAHGMPRDVAQLVAANSVLKGRFVWEAWSKRR